MKNFSFTSHDPNNDIESILKQRKKTIAKQQLTFTLIFVSIIIIIILWAVNRIIYTEFDGYLNTDMNVLRSPEDLYVLENHRKVGDFIAPGDTLVSYVYAENFFNHETSTEEPTVIAQNRNMTVQYGLAKQDLSVTRVKIKELKRQLATTDHNIRFGLSDNQNKMKIEQELAEAESLYKAQKRKLSVLHDAMRETNDAVRRLYNEEYGFLHVQDMRNIELMKELDLIRYSIAIDSGIVTKVHTPGLTLTLRGEPIMTTQSFNLAHNNLSVVAYVMPDQMKHINRNTQAEVIVNNDVSFSASVLMLGTRTEELPMQLRSTLSQNHTAVVVVLGPDPNQIIPFWCLVKNIPVKIRINNFKKYEHEKKDYMLFNTTSGLIHSTMDGYHNKVNDYTLDNDSIISYDSINVTGEIIVSQDSTLILPQKSTNTSQKMIEEETQIRTLEMPKIKSPISYQKSENKQ